MKKKIEKILICCFIMLLIVSSYNPNYIVTKGFSIDTKDKISEYYSTPVINKSLSDFQYVKEIYYRITGIGNWSTKASKLNGNWVYCVEPMKQTPPEGGYEETIINNDDLLKVLYYGYGSEGLVETEPWLQDEANRNGWEVAYIYTHVMASRAYNGVWQRVDMNSAAMQAISKYYYPAIMNKPSPGILQFSDTEWKGVYNESTGTQRTQTIQLQALPKVKVYIPVQEGVTLHNVTTGETFQGNGTDTAIIKGQESFYLETDKAKMENYSQPALKGENLRRYYAVGINLGNPATQTESAIWYTDNFKLGFNLTWGEIDDFPSIKKVDQNGVPLANVDLSLYPSDSNYKTTGDAVIKGTTNQNGKLEIDKTNLNYTMQGLYSKSKYYVLKEELPNGYRKGDDIHLKFTGPAEQPYFLVDNSWDSGAISEIKQVIEFDPAPYQSEISRLRRLGFEDIVLALKKDNKYIYNDNNMWKSTDNYADAYAVNPLIFKRDAQRNYEVNFNIPSYLQLDSIDIVACNPETGDVAKFEETINYTSDKTSNIILSNIANQFTVEKVNTIKEPLHNVKFELYDESSVIKNGNNISIIKNSFPYDLGNTNEQGKIIFGINGNSAYKKPLITGHKYYLKEAETLEGYILNSNIVEIIVDNDGVIADSKELNDGVKVKNGIGMLTNNMKLFASKESLDTSLHGVQSIQRISNNGQTWEVNGAKSHYLYNDKDDNYLTVNGFDKYLTTDKGLNSISIKQCLTHDTNEINAKKQNLKDLKLNQLFTGDTIIEIENIPESKIIVEKKVNGSENDLDRTFKFTIKIDGVEEGYKIPYKDISSVTGGSGVIKNGETFTLKHGQEYEFTIPAGKKVTITEETGSDFTTKNYLVQSPNTITYSNVYEDIDGVDSNERSHIIFENTFYLLKNFEFMKTDGSDSSPLSGAMFVIYEKKCTHNHNNDLIEISKNSGDLTNESQKECWTLINKFESDTLGKVSIKNLKTNKEYRLIEYQAPNGYLLPNGQWILKYNKQIDKFEISGSVHNPPAFKTSLAGELYLPNYKVTPIPITGSNGITIFIVVGMIFMLIGGMLHKKKLKR